jgi:capsular exopolysaccharide synthesis family protein
MISVYIGVELRTPHFQSKVMILVSGQMQKDIEVLRALGPGSLVDTQMVLVMSVPIIKRTVEALRLYQRPLDYEKRYATKLKSALIEYSVKETNQMLEKMTDEQKHVFLVNRAINDLAGKIKVSAVKETSMFSINVRDYDPRSTAVIANVVSRSYVIFDIEQQIAELQLTYGEKNSTIIKLENYIDKLKESLDGRPLPDIEAIGPASVKIVGQAGRGFPLPMKPGKTTALIIGFIMSTILSVSLAYLFDYFDQTFRSPRDVETFLNIRYLGSLPQIKLKDELLISHSNPKSTDYSLSFQNLSESIYLIINDKNINSFLIVDAEGSEGTAVAVANIGIYLAHKVGARVLIIDANSRNTPVRVSNVLNIFDATGLTDVLDGQAAYEEVVQDLGPNLNILPAGKSVFNPITLLESSALSDLIRKTKEKYDVVLISCADIKNYTDAVILSSISDGVVLVINEGRIRRQIVESAIVPLKEKQANIIGGILANRTHVIPGLIYKLT